MRAIERSGAFKRQYKLMMKRGKNIQKLDRVIVMLAMDEPLPASLRDHGLTGNFAGLRDCHIEPDWLLIYQKKQTVEGDVVISLLCLEATGTHSDLF
ncbi:MAG: type II toxin-antitoxin system YafQ family toxin [Flavobacteriales bacterium]